MNLLGPDRYRLTFDAENFSVVCPRGTPRFSGFAASDLPKLYIASVADWPIYVGVTKQRIRARLRMGWNADGQHGYHGYVWRNHHTEAVLDIWCHVDPQLANSILDIETVEAEVVFLIRLAGQWPTSQTEIHFRPPTEVHREAARRILATYKRRVPEPSPTRPG
jgi:hypothetical protein